MAIDWFNAIHWLQDEPLYDGKNVAPNSRIVALRFDADAIVHRSANPLLAAEIPLSGLRGNMPEEELNLLQLSACGMAQLRA